MAKFIELHHDGERIALRVELIASVTEYDDVRSTEVGMAGESGGWNVDENYDCVMDKIREAEDGKHGRWEDFCRGKMCCCSACKAEFDNTCNEIHGEWKFCPNCGAKMDGGKDNG